MGGAFVGIADDASAVYWNPAGAARGAYFSLLLDGGTADVTPSSGLEAGRRSGWLLALSTPVFGLSYYRLKATTVRPSSPQPLLAGFRIDSLTTHHGGITLVQSLTDAIAVGSTVKVVRGVAASALAPAGSAEALLHGWDLIGRSTTKLDLDVGIMATGTVGSAGVAVRNVTEPAFETGGGTELQMDRQVRAGAAIWLLRTWRLAADADFTTARGPLGDVRQVAVGTESQLTRRIAARGGLRLNTAGDRGRTPAWSAGASYSVLGSFLVDAQGTFGSDDTLRGWGLAGRLVF